MLTLKTNKMNKKQLSRLYKTIFADGTIYFSRVCLTKGYSEKTFISNTISVYKSNLRNPKRQTMITEFEKRVFNELNSLKCEIVYEGPTTEAMKLRDELILKTPNCGNSNKSKNNEGRIAKDVIKVAKTLSKVINNGSGQIISYVDREWARKKGLWEFINFSNEYPLNTQFVEILKPIKRI